MFHDTIGNWLNLTIYFKHLCEKYNHVWVFLALLNKYIASSRLDKVECDMTKQC